MKNEYKDNHIWSPYERFPSQEVKTGAESLKLLERFPDSAQANFSNFPQLTVLVVWIAVVLSKIPFNPFWTTKNKELALFPTFLKFFSFSLKCSIFSHLPSPPRVAKANLTPFHRPNLVCYNWESSYNCWITILYGTEVWFRVPNTCLGSKTQGMIG